MQSVRSILAIGIVVSLAFTTAISAKISALPSDIYDQVATRLHGYHGASNCGPLPDFKITYNGNGQWLMVLPIMCIPLNERDMTEGYFWTYGGTAGPLILAFRYNTNGKWEQILEERAHAAYFEGGSIFVIKHHIACNNPTSGSCIKRYRWISGALRLVSAND